ncbi:MAG: serine hydrolase domain-containing protein [Kofleriaceae bacterium]
MNAPSIRRPLTPARAGITPRAAAFTCALLAACGTPPRSPSRPVAAPATQPAVVEAPAPAAAAPPAAPAMRQLAAETPVTMGNGAAFTAAPGWWLADERAGVVRLEEPSRELTMWITSSGAPDRADAIAEAWQRIRPGFALAIEQADERPGTDGWDAVAQVVYVTPAAASQLVVAVAMRLGPTWYVALVDGGQAAFGRRSAQLGATIKSLRAPGLARESFAGRPIKLDAETLRTFDAFVEEARVAAGIPGVAVEVVSGDRVLLATGHGVRALGARAAVTPATRFMIGSTTKSLTTLLMAALADRGVLTWDAPVTTLLPGFALGDAATTAALTLRHTVCACTGMPRQDLEFIMEYAGWTPERRLAMMKDMSPTTGFGETFQYSNLMVAAGGYAAGRATTKAGPLAAAYAGALARYVLAPLGMRATTLTLATGKRADAAQPHARDLAQAYHRIPLADEGAVESVAPAGGAWSTVEDLGRYLQLELRHGRRAGAVVVSDANLLARRAPQVKISGHRSYGLGLFLDDELGVPVAGHGGNTIGFTSDLFFLPDHDVGVVVLANAGGANDFRAAVRRRFLELAFAGQPEAEPELTHALAQAKVDADAELALIDRAAPAAWSDALRGRYQAAGIGTVEIRRVGDRVVFDVGEWSSSLGRYRGRDGSDRVVLLDPPWAGFTLLLATDGDHPKLVIDTGQHTYELRRTTP